MATADAALRDTFTLQGVTAVQPRRPDGGFDWDWRGPRNDPEWAWFFNRHLVFTDLLAAYQQTGDVRYRDRILVTLDDWIAQHPAPSGITFSAAWRPLEAARRVMESWIPIYAALRDDPAAFPPERRARFVASIRDHALHLRNHHAFSGNHLITEMLALTRLGLTFSDLPDAAGWRSYALDRLARAYEDQVYPDGAHKELSSHYQRVVALNYQELLDLLRASGQEEAVREWEPRVHRLWDYFAAIMKPDGTNPLNNDSDTESVAALLRQYAPHIRIPEQTVRLPWAGQVIFRSRAAAAADAAGVRGSGFGVQGSANAAAANNAKPRTRNPKPAAATPPPLLYAFFDTGPRGTDHDHADFLHVSLSVGASDFLVDNGRYTYTPGAFRDYFAGPSGHNVLLLDGLGPDQGPRAVTAAADAAGVQGSGFRVQGSDSRFPSPAGNPKPETLNPEPAASAAPAVEIAWGDTTFASASRPAFAANPRAADWRRLVAHVPGRAWIVVDRVITFSPATLTTLWHWSPECTVEPVPGQPDSLIVSRSSATLHVRHAASQPVPADRQQITARSRPSPQGWYSPRFNMLEPASCTQLDQAIRAPLVNVWLFSPAALPGASIRISADHRIVVQLDPATSLTLDPEAPGKSAVTGTMR
ncbi:heparinase [Opitutaceae bacterium TAV5]|nr:heparinase [Opitutaceae bacterium TAV5]